MKNRFQLKKGQIRGRIDNIKLTFLCLGQKEHTLHLDFMPNQSLTNSLNLKQSVSFFNLT